MRPGDEEISTPPSTKSVRFGLITAGVLVAGVRAPHTWAELQGLLADLSQGRAQPPEWLLQGASLNDEAGSGAPISGSVALEPATYGPICLTGTFPDLEFAPGTTLEVAAR